MTTSRYCSHRNNLAKRLQAECTTESRAATQENRELRAELNESRGEAARLQRELAAHKAQIGELVPENETLRDRVDELGGKLTQALEQARRADRDSQDAKAQWYPFRYKANRIASPSWPPWLRNGLRIRQNSSGCGKITRGSRYCTTKHKNM